MIFKIIQEDYPSSVMMNGIIDVRNRKGENIGLMNLKSNTADSKDEYMQMRMQGLMSDILP